MFGGTCMDSLQMSISKAYSLPKDYQTALSKIIDQFVEVAASKSSTKKSRLGIADGKYQFPDDIDFCNDEIAELFGMVDEQ